MSAATLAARAQAQGRQAEEALLQVQAALQEVPGRLQAPDEAGLRDAQAQRALRPRARHRQEDAQGCAGALALDILRATWPPASSRVVRGSWDRICAMSCSGAVIAWSASTISRPGPWPTSPTFAVRSSCI